MKHLSQKQIVDTIMVKYVDEFVAARPEFTIDQVKHQLGAMVREIDMLDLRTLEKARDDGEWIKIAGRKCLPSEVLMIRQQITTAVSEHFLDVVDRTRTSIDAGKLWRATTRDLFEKLHYEEKRAQWLVCCDGPRVLIAAAGPKHYKLADLQQDQNHAAVVAKYEEDLKMRRRRDRIFKANPDCFDTDDVMSKLYGWKPPA